MDLQELQQATRCLAKQRTRSRKVFGCFLLAFRKYVSRYIYIWLTAEENWKACELKITKRVVAGYRDGSDVECFFGSLNWNLIQRALRKDVPEVLFYQGYIVKILLRSLLISFIFWSMYPGSGWICISKIIQMTIMHISCLNSLLAQCIKFTIHPAEKHTRCYIVIFCFKQISMVYRKIVSTKSMWELDGDSGH